MLKDDRFNKTSLVLLFVDGTRVNCKRYSYESHNKLYDIDVLETGNIRYLVNCTPSDKTKYHGAIEKHFGI